MSWLYEVHRTPSQKNGEIVSTRLFGQWTVTVNNCDQASPFLGAMWQDAIQRVKQHKNGRSIEKILIIGLGPAQLVKILSESFPLASIEGIEHDPAMISVAKQIKLYEPFPFPKVYVDDAESSIVNLDGPYDLIIHDLFSGITPSDCLKEFSYASHIARLLNSGALLLANVYKNVMLGKDIHANIITVDSWNYKGSSLFIYTARL